MTHILIVYASSLGNTQKMAEAAVEGVNSVNGCKATLKRAEEAGIDYVRPCDGLMIGTPIRHRSADGRVKKFIEDTLEILWLRDEMLGKVGAVFSVGGGYGNQGAGVEIAQLGVLAAMAACGMVTVPLPKTTPGAALATLGSAWPFRRNEYGTGGCERGDVGSQLPPCCQYSPISQTTGGKLRVCHWEQSPFGGTHPDVFRRRINII